MSEFQIEVDGGSTVRLPTGGKYCDRDILVTAKGGGSDLNIAFGENPPEDMGKMWVKSSQADGVDIAPYEPFFDLPESMPYGYSCGCTIAIDKKIYLISPQRPLTNVADKTICCYDTEREVFSTLPETLPNARSGARATLYNDKVYIFGGRANTTINYDVLCWDYKTGDIDPLSETIPTHPCYCGLARINNKVYLFGGESTNGNSTTKRILCYDLDTQEPQTMSITLPANRTKVGCVVYEGNIYIFGGENSGTSYNTIYRFKPEEGSIAQFGTLPVTLSNFVMGIQGDKVYLMYGYSIKSSSYTYNDRVYEYNLKKATKTVMPIVVTGANVTPAFCQVTENEIYLFGGSYVVGNTQTTKIFQFKTLPMARNQHLTIIPSETGTPVTVFSGENEVRVGVFRVYMGNSDGIGVPVESFIYEDGEWVAI